MLTVAGVPETARPAHAFPGIAQIPDGLLARLRHPDPGVRRGAAWALGRVPAELVRPNVDRAVVTRHIVEALDRESDLSVSLALVAALATRTWPGSVDEIRALAAGPVRRDGMFSRGTLRRAVRPEVRAAALQVLGTLGDSDDEALRPLLEAGATDTEGIAQGPVSDASARAMAELPDFALRVAITRASNAPSQLAGVLRALGLRGDPVLGGLVLQHAVLPARPWTVAAVDTIAMLGLTEAAPRLVAMVAQRSVLPGDLSARRAAVRALGSLGGGFDVGVLRDAIADPALRDVALASAGRLGDTGLVPAVARMLDAPWSQDRMHAAEALGALGSAEALTPLAQRLSREAQPDVRRSVTRAIARIGGREAVGILTEASDDPYARWALVELALRGAGSPSGRGEDASARGARAWAGEPPDPRGLGATTEGERIATAMALGAGCTDAEALARALDREGHEGARMAMVLALGRARPTSVAEGALGLLLTREADEPSSAAVAAASIAGRRGLWETVPALRRMLRSRWGIARTEAAHALGMLGDPGARTALEEMLMFDEDADARGTAAVALAVLEGPGVGEALRAAAMTAWTGTLRDRIARAETAARTGTLPWTTGTAVTRVGGAVPGSVWAVTLPDGGHAYGVATEDGEVMIPGAPEGVGELQRVDERVGVSLPDT